MSPVGNRSMHSWVTAHGRQANDAIGSGSEGAAHGMHGMDDPTEPAPADTNESQPTTSGDHREHRP